MIYLEGHFYLLWIHVVVLVIGGVLTGLKKADRSGSWYDLASAYAVGVVFMALAGWLCVVLGRSTVLASILTIILPLVLAGKWWRDGAKSRLFGWMSRSDVAAFSIWVLFLHGTLALATQPIPFPDNIPDGLFVNRENKLSMRVQFIAGPLPADNYIPYAVGECLLRDVPFAQNTKILPGQLVTDRTFLAALFYLPFRMTLTDKPPVMSHVPTYNYLNTPWPNTWIFNDDALFVKFLAAGILLNGLLLLGAMALAEFLYDRSICWMVMLLLAVMPYMISQTMFTWPKAAAGFFIIMASLEAFSKKRFLVAGFYAGVAYNCHPCAIAFMLGLALGIVVDFFSTNRTWRSGAMSLAQYLGACFLVLLPWIVWKEWIVQLPSDLIQQNFNLEGPMGQLVWQRILNLSRLLVSGPMSQATDEQASVIRYDFSLIFSVGILLFVPAVWEACVMSWRKPAAVFCAFILPSIFIVAVFSGPALAIVHGLQVLIAVLVILAVARLRQSMKGALLAIVLAQVTLHLVFIVWRLVILAHQGFLV